MTFNIYPTEFSAAFERFFDAYIQAAVFCEEESVLEGKDADFVFAPETISELFIKAASFFATNAELIASACTAADYWLEQAGHDLWLTSNGHGAGYWDRGLGDIGDKLTKAAKENGSVDLYLSDDGLVRL
jgi:hypothetical protein